MVEVINPQLGEVILDAAWWHRRLLVSPSASGEACKTVEDRQVLQNQSIFGGEAKPAAVFARADEFGFARLESQDRSADQPSFPLQKSAIEDRVDIIMTTHRSARRRTRQFWQFPEDKNLRNRALFSSSYA